ncbi:MAG: CsgG/HfaB family protein [Endomicrobiales bacterium]
MKPRLAVLTFETQNVDKGTVQAVTEYAQSCLENTKLYVMVERDKILKVLQEQSFQLSGAADSSTIVSLGKLLGASKLVMGSINTMGDRAVLSARIVNVETGEIEMSATEEDTLSRTNESVRKLVRTLIGNDRSDYQAYLRGIQFDNSLRLNAGNLMFMDESIIQPMSNGTKSFSLSLRMKEFPFFSAHNFLTEFEAGYFTASGWSMDKTRMLYGEQKAEYLPLSVSLQYYVPLSFIAEPYLKAGAGMAYRHWTMQPRLVGGSWPYTYYSGAEINNGDSFWPFGKVGFGLDFSRSKRLGLQAEILYNYYAMEDVNPSGLSLSAGLSYNW